MTIANKPTTLRMQIEALWTNGVRPENIAIKLNATRLYVDQVIYFASRRPTPDTAFKGDDDKHLALIRQANQGMGFPYCITRSRAA